MKYDIIEADFSKFNKTDKKPVHIALDFDKTLANHESDWPLEKIGEPIIPMLNKLKDWLNKGYKVSIFTARMSSDKTPEVRDAQRKIIEDFFQRHRLPKLPITANKHPEFSHFIDDRAYHAEPNMGQISDEIDI
jgi:hypothetical protein